MARTLFEPPDFEGHANPRHLKGRAYKDLGRDAALGVTRANGARNVAVGFPDGDSFAPTRIRVTVRDPATSDAGGHHHEAAIRASSDAELAPPAQIGLPLSGDGEYPGHFGRRPAQCCLGARQAGAHAAGPRLAPWTISERLVHLVAVACFPRQEQQSPGAIASLPSIDDWLKSEVEPGITRSALDRTGPVQRPDETSLSRNVFR